MYENDKTVEATPRRGVTRATAVLTTLLTSMTENETQISLSRVWCTKADYMLGDANYTNVSE